MTTETKSGCPPCRGDCNQGRTCPARPQRSLGDLIAAVISAVTGGRA